jgi:glycosyltransferase involved in cell wall biosynthesis
MRRSPAVTVVVPVHNDAATVGQCLSAIRGSDLPRDAFEIIVVDQNSSDASKAIAARYADTVIRLTTGGARQAYARNRGAELGTGEVVAFVDAHIMVQPDTLTRMLTMLCEQPYLQAISASRDAKPVARNFISQYWNLLLHFGERKSHGLGGNFGSGCGMIRRSTFVLAGMYDEWRFGTGNLEGIELGQRLEAAGHQVLFSTELQVTHLRRWTGHSVFREVWDRTALLARSLGYRRTLASIPGEAVFTLTRAAVPALAILATAVLSAGFLSEPSWILRGSLAAAVASLINLPVLRFYTRERGLLFAAAALPVHFFYQVVGVVAMCAGWLTGEAVGDRLPDAATQAYSEVGVEMWPPVPRQR